MFKKVVEYVDFNGEPNTAELYFNMTQREAVRFDLEFEGGLEKYVAGLNADKDQLGIMNLFERLLLSSYGEKTEDGKHFLKDQDIQDRFKQSAVYDALFTSLLQDTDQAVQFFNEVVSTAIPQVTTPGKTAA